MAAEPARKESATNVQPLKRKPRSKLPWILLGIGVLAAGGGGSWYALKPAPPAAQAASGAQAPADAPRAAPIYYKFDPAFVVNFGGPGSARFLQVTLEAMSRDPAILDVLKNNDPAVRNDLVLLFSGQDEATLMSTEGKEKLRAETLAAIQKVLDEEGANGKLIEQVYFTSFVIQ
ncbi:MAG TPA: flagellar basal body-associated FliL family protein [Steroidobacteraceae bacterium]|nr:flagellar basal body-associated FliL family protein [Steroidobacteraceae bacterium]